MIQPPFLAPGVVACGGLDRLRDRRVDGGCTDGRAYGSLEGRSGTNGATFSASSALDSNFCDTRFAHCGCCGCFLWLLRLFLVVVELLLSLSSSWSWMSH